MKPLLIIKTGRKIPLLDDVAGDYEDWIAAGARLPPARVRVVKVCDGEPLPPVASVAAAMITGSAAMVTERAPWMLDAEEWLRAAAAHRLPVLGICFGHQLLARALGGEVAYNPRGLELGTVPLRLTAAAREDALFHDWSDATPVQVTHRQSVTRLPPGAVLLASSDLDPHQAFRVGSCAWGLQFHPEFDRSKIARFVRHFGPLLREEGKDPAQLQAALGDTPASQGLLHRFAAGCVLAGSG